MALNGRTMVVECCVVGGELFGLVMGLARFGGEFFKHQGYDVKQSFSKQTDGGVDIWLTKDGELSLVQCKHWKARKVGVQVLREMYGVMIEHQASKMIIVTSGDFTAEAITFAQGKRLWLVNGSELVHMIEEGRSLTQKPVIEEPSPQF